MLTGKVPASASGQRHWLIAETPGWTPGAHWISTPPTGRFTHDITRRALEVRTAAEWFGGGGELTPEQARQAWDLTGAALKAVSRDSELLKSPAATGAQLWARSLPKGLDPEPLPDDVASLLHRTSGQHRIEHLTSGPSACSCGGCRPLLDLDAGSGDGARGGFAYVDGRFMYASLCRELGTGPARWLTGPEAEEVFTRDSFVRARFRVRFRVPEWWDTVGILPLAHEDADDGWHYPNVSGFSAETWVDAAEASIALNSGWDLQILEGIAFQKGRVLDTWADRLRRARAGLAENTEVDPAVRSAAVAAVRAILIQGIGAFASRGRETTHVVKSAREVPPHAVASVVRHGDVFVYRSSTTRPSGQAQALYRPELAAQVWARGRARVLECPTALSRRSNNGGMMLLGGALALDPKTLIAINGDAIYSTEIPGWALPVEHGGGDDGNVGRMRLQGWLTDVKLPSTTAQRNVLRQQSEAAGIEAALAPAGTPLGGSSSVPGGDNV